MAHLNRHRHTEFQRLKPLRNVGNHNVVAKVAARKLSIPGLKP